MKDKIFVSEPCIGEAERGLVNEAISRNQLTYGPMCKRFELELAHYLGVRHVLVTSNGTTALHLALVANNIGPGDEVLVPDSTFVATANAVSYTGATPVLVDIDEETWGMDPADAERKITSRTRAIIPVHLYGRACRMDELLSFGIPVIEDAAEGFTGTYQGRKLGAIGHAGTFSFYGNKIITCGEGGAIATNDSEFYAWACHFRGQAMTKKRYMHDMVGFNYRMTDLQAAVGLGQLFNLQVLLSKRRQIFEIYQERLGYNVGASCVSPDNQHAPWLFTLQLHTHVDRDGLMQRLEAEGIETRPTFVPLHQMPMYRGDDSDFPVATALGDHGISLPTHPNLSPKEVEWISDRVLANITTT